MWHFLPRCPPQEQRPSVRSKYWKQVHYSVSGGRPRAPSLCVCVWSGSLLSPPPHHRLKYHTPGFTSHTYNTLQQTHTMPPDGNCTAKRKLLFISTAVYAKYTNEIMCLRCEKTSFMRC